MGSRECRRKLEVWRDVLFSELAGQVAAAVGLV